VLAAVLHAVGCCAVSTQAQAGSGTAALVAKCNSIVLDQARSVGAAKAHASKRFGTNQADIKKQVNLQCEDPCEWHTREELSGIPEVCHEAEGARKPKAGPAWISPQLILHSTKRCGQPT